MKINLPLTLFLILSIFSAQAQKDFDYTLFTTRAHLFFVREKKDSNQVNLFILRQIIKQNSSLKIVSLENTGQSQEYHIHYIGFSPDSSEFIYEGKDERGERHLFYIQPTVPIVRVFSNLIEWKGKPEEEYF